MLGGFLRLAFWLTSLCCCSFLLDAASSEIHRDPRFSILPALESLSYGALWLFPFYTEVRFALVAPALANSYAARTVGICGDGWEMGIELAQV